MENGTTYMVRPRMQPSKSSRMVLRISCGSDQLLSGPASVLLSEQMNVCSSTRATSPTSAACVVRVGTQLLVQRNQSAGANQAGDQMLIFKVTAYENLN
jgi:hypothetical protein